MHYQTMGPVHSVALAKFWISSMSCLFLVDWNVGTYLTCFQTQQQYLGYSLFNTLQEYPSLWIASLILGLSMIISYTYAYMHGRNPYIKSYMYMIIVFIHVSFI